MKKYCCLMLTICLAIFTGCSKEPAPDMESQTRRPILIWSYYEVKAQRDALDYWLQEFNRSQKQYTASWKHIPFSEFARQLAIGYTGDNQPDLVIIDNPDMATFITQDIFEDITDEVGGWDNIDKYYPQCMETVTADGRMYGLPFCVNNLALFYDKALLVSEGVQPPQNAEDLIAVARELTVEGRTGFAMSAAASEQGAFQLLPWVLEAGKDISDLGNGYTRAGLTVLGEMVINGAISSNCINYSQQDIARLFVEGKTAMMENGPWILPMLKESEKDYGIVPLPINGATVLGGENLGIVKSGNMDGALALIRFYNQDEIMVHIAQQSCALPPRKDLAERYLGENADYAVFVEQMETSVPRSSLQSWASVSALLNDIHRGVLADRMEPDQACAIIRQYVLDNIADGS